MTNSKILIVDDHPLVREGLAAQIEAQPGLEVCGEAAEADAALVLIDQQKPDLVIIDLTLSGGHGLDLIKKIHERRPSPKTLVFSAHDETLYAHRALEAGALGYVNKQETKAHVIDAISTVLRGERYLSEAATRHLVDRAIRSNKLKSSNIDYLSNRELEVFEFIGRGKSTRAIAEQLHLSIHTIETHRENIRAKLGLRSGAELTRSAVQWVLESGNSN